MIRPPPSLESLPAGTRLVAGMGYATVMADMDFETYSEAGYIWNGGWVGPHRSPSGRKGLPVVGAARYAEHPSTEVLCFGYDLKDGAGRRQWLPGSPPPEDFFDHIRAGRPVEAWNAGFERHIWEKICVPRMGWPAISRGQWRCAMAKAKAFSLPGRLIDAAPVVGSKARKNPAGKRLLDLFSVPRKPTKKDPRLRLFPQQEPDGPALYAYNLTDIQTEAEVSSLVPDLPPAELRYWQADQEINTRGVHIDIPAVKGCAAVVEEALACYDAELRALTGGEVAAASRVQALTQWLRVQGVSLVSLDGEAVAAALAGELPPQGRRALEIRALIGSASVKKVFAMLNQVCGDDRLRDLFTFHGARTGRATGNGPQPTNLPNHGPEVRRCTPCGKHFGASKPCCMWCGADVAQSLVKEWSPAAVEDAIPVLLVGSLVLTELYFDEALPLISGCLRGMFIAAPGHDLVSSDYNAIEAVVLAELAGESWRQEVFRTHGNIYEMSASKISGTSLEEILEHRITTGKHHPLRKLGKTLELALGFGGWIGSLIAFGADEFMSETEMADGAMGWREASPAIIELWGGQHRRNPWRPELFGIEGAAISAVLSPGQEFACRGIGFQVRGDVLYCQLLSGRRISYHRPRLAPSTRKRDEWTLSYEGWNTNPKNGPMGWIRIETYGPKLVENIVQATACDIQRDSIVRQEDAGYPIVLHVYDENVAEVAEGTGSVEAFEGIMAELPAWAAGWPVKATGGWRGKRYR